MDYIFLTGITGATILVIGSAWPESKTKNPALCIKNWLLAIGALFMFTYSLTGYLYQDAPIFFTFLQTLIIISSIFMMIKTNDALVTGIIGFAGTGLIIWALSLFEGYGTIIFILGLIGIALGYSLTGGTIKRFLAFVLGSIFIAIFSYIEKNWIFFWLNIFFAIFSTYYLIQILKLRLKHEYPPASKP